LNDLEEIKGDASISPEEYSEMKADTETQIAEFEKFLERMMKEAKDKQAAKEAQEVRFGFLIDLEN
jgi:hypothetical protein